MIIFSIFSIKLNVPLKNNSCFHSFSHYFHLRTIMSTERGNMKKKGQAHQNTFTFKHNKNSKLTAKIMSMPIAGIFHSQSSPSHHFHIFTVLFIGVCDKCKEKIEWKKKYRKYKPLTAPGKWYVFITSSELIPRMIFWFYCNTEEFYIILLFLAFVVDKETSKRPITTSARTALKYVPIPPTTLSSP